MRDAALGEFDDPITLLDEDNRRFTMGGDKPFLLEREIRGAFAKFNSNSGWSCGEDPILDAFSHWTWVESGGAELVCDLQGHRGDGQLPYLGSAFYYLLTDPCICTRDREYGESDLGPAGIGAFFQNHVCNEWCEHLDIEYERPAYVNAGRLQTRMSTSYHSIHT